MTVFTKSFPKVNNFYPYYEGCLAFASVNNERSPGPSYFPRKAGLEQGRFSISTNLRFSESCAQTELSPRQIKSNDVIITNARSPIGQDPSLMKLV